MNELALWLSECKG